MREPWSARPEVVGAIIVVLISDQESSRGWRHKACGSRWRVGAIGRNGTNLPAANENLLPAEILDRCMKKDSAPR